MKREKKLSNKDRKSKDRIERSLKSTDSSSVRYSGGTLRFSPSADAGVINIDRITSRTRILDRLKVQHTAGSK